MLFVGRAARNKREGAMQERKFEDLKSRQKARETAKAIYLLTQDNRFRRDFALADQMRRAAISIPANIAEGFERNSVKEFIQFLYIAKASSGELRSHLYLASDLGYLPEKTFENPYDQCDHLYKNAEQTHSVLEGPKRRREEISRRFPFSSSRLAFSVSRLAA